MFTITKNPLKEISAEQLAVSGKDLYKLRELYKTSQLVTELDAINLPVKIIVIGNSESGKTTLCKEIIKDKSQFDETDDRSTHGLKIRNWKYEDELRALFYDFGGQDYYHASYQMFFSKRAIYLLLWDAKYDHNKKIVKEKADNELDNINPYINYTPEYWYENILYYQSNTENDKSDSDQIKIFALQNLFKKEAPKTLHLHHTPNKPDIDHQFHIALYPSPKKLDRRRLTLLDHTLREEVDLLSRKLKLRGNEKAVIERIKSQVGHPDTKYKIQQVSDFVSQMNDQSDDNLQVLHLMGMVLYFHEHEQLNDVYWVDPSTVSKKIYAVLKQLKTEDMAPEKITVEEMKAACENDKLSTLMETQEIIFKDVENKYYIIPQYLPEKTGGDPLYVLATQGMKEGFSLLFQKFVPHGMMSRLICRFGRNPFKKHYYRYEIVFSLGRDGAEVEDTAKVRITLDPIALSMDVRVTLPSSAKIKKEELYSYLFRSILAAYENEPHMTFSAWEEMIHQPDREPDPKIGKHIYVPPEIEKHKEDNPPSPWHKTEFEEFVPHDLHISVDGSDFVEYAKLKTQKDKKDIEIEPTPMVESWYKVKDELIARTIKRAPFNPFVRKKADKVKSVFISYAHDDLEYQQELLKHLINLERDHIIEVWQDGKITPSMDWDKTIKSQIEKADIFIMLVSQNFIASSYIHRVEMRKAFDQMQSGQTQILPILLSECDWEEWNIYGVELGKDIRKSGRVGNYQFAPTYTVADGPDATPDARLRPINRWQYPEDAWKKIVKYLRTGRMD